MKTSHKLKTLAAAAATCIGLFAAMPANALVYAVSHLKVSDFTLNIGGAGVSTDITSFSFDMTNTASLNALNSGLKNAGCGSVGTACGFGPVLDPLQARVGNPIYAENTFTMHSPPSAVDSYSRADGILTTAELVQGLPTSFELIAESLLNINGQAAANSTVQSSTNLLIKFTVTGGPANLVLSFMADPDQQVINSGPVGTYLSQANMVSSFTLTQESTSDSVQWSALGSAANNCNSDIGGVTCAENSDTQRLNGNLSTGVNPSNQVRSFDLADVSTLFGITISGLAAGDYSIALNAGVSTAVRQTVPEPGALALVGLALAGLSLVGRRREQRQA